MTPGPPRRREDQPYGEDQAPGHGDLHLEERPKILLPDGAQEDPLSWSARVRSDIAGALWGRPIRDDNDDNDDNDAVRIQTRGDDTIGRVTRVSVVGVGLMIFGVLLGVADQASGTTPGDLRVPALLGALFLVGQGLTFFLQGLRQEKAERMERDIAKKIAERTGGESQIVGESERGPLVIATASSSTCTAIQPAKLVTHTLPQPQRGASGIALMLMVLAVWLGLETLTVDAPPTLSGLSLLGSFLLFAFGWKTLVDPD